MRQHVDDAADAVKKTDLAKQLRLLPGQREYAVDCGPGQPGKSRFARYLSQVRQEQGDPGQAVVQIKRTQVQLPATVVRLIESDPDQVLLRLQSEGLQAVANCDRSRDETAVKFAQREKGRRLGDVVADLHGG